MRVLILTRDYPPDIGGIATVVRSVALNLKAVGHNTMILCPDQGEGPNIREIDGINVQRFPYKHGLGEISFPGRDSKYLWAVLPEVIRNFNPDIIWSFWPNFSVALSQRDDHPPYLHLPPNAMSVYFDGLLAGVKIGTISPRLLVNSVLWYIARWKAKVWEKQILQSNLKTVVLSQNVKRQYDHIFPDLKDKVIVVYPGFDEERFQPLPFQQTSSEIKKKWGIPADQLLLLFIGRLSPDKNLHMLLSAQKKLRERYPSSYQKATLLLVGKGLQEAALIRYVTRNDLKVTFCGFQYETLNQYYSAAWALILPTIFESFGYSMIEAGLCCTPSIAFLPHPPKVQTAADEIISHDLTGLLVSFPSSDALCEALHQAVCWDEDKRDYMGQLSRKKIMEKYNWGTFIKSVLDLST